MLMVNATTVFVDLKKKLYFCKNIIINVNDGLKRAEMA